MGVVEAIPVLSTQGTQKTKPTKPPKNGFHQEQNGISRQRERVCHQNG